jgi:hypothetical protein
MRYCVNNLRLMLHPPTNIKLWLDIIEQLSVFCGRKNSFLMIELSNFSITLTIGFNYGVSYGHLRVTQTIHICYPLATWPRSCLSGEICTGSQSTDGKNFTMSFPLSISAEQIMVARGMTMPWSQNYSQLEGGRNDDALDDWCHWWNLSSSR